MRNSRYTRNWLVWLSFTCSMLLACNLLPLEQPGLEQPRIVFVTPTPPSTINLREGQRSLELPPASESSAQTETFFAGANELGQVLVLEYHRIGYPEQRYQRTPQNLRADLERLYQSGYYPVNFIEIIQGLADVPAGKKPIALTFDDSDISQFRVLANGAVDADSAMGVLLNFHYQHPTDWPTRATFFVLGNDSNNHYSIFGQSELAREKLQVLVDMGMEVGSHTVSHADLSVATAERIYWELAVSQQVIEDLIPGYKVQTLSVPFGGFPYTLDFLKAGQWEDLSYHYIGNVAAWGGPGVSPFDPTFEPYDVSRLEVTETSLDHWLNYFEQNPHEYYIADGDPNRVTFPQQVNIASE